MLLLGAGNEFVEVGDNTNGGNPSCQFRVVFLTELPGGVGMGPVVRPVVSEELDHNFPFGCNRMAGKGETVELIHTVPVVLEGAVGKDAPGEGLGRLMVNLVLQGSEGHEWSVGEISLDDRGV